MNQIKNPASSSGVGNSHTQEYHKAKEQDIALTEPTIPPTEEWPELKPLSRALAEPEDFPIEAFPPVLLNPTKTLNKTIKAPIALCGTSILASATLAAQPYVDVVIDGRSITISNFFVTIGESGERKSSVDTEALAPHRNHQKYLSEKYLETQRQHEQEESVFQATHKEIVAKKRQSREEKLQALQDLGPPPKPPLKPFCLTSEPTYEGLIKMLADGQPSVGIFSDEGGRLIGGHALNDENQLKTAAGLSELWDGGGKAISRTRSGEGQTLLYGRRVSMHLMIQPTVMSRLVGNGLLQGQGLLSRCLISFPTSTIGTRQYAETDTESYNSLDSYNEHLSSVLRRALPLAEGTQNELKPQPIMLSRDAKTSWVEFHDFVENELREEGQYHSIRGFASKAAEHVLRIAGVLSFIQNPDSRIIEKVDLTRAIALVRYFLNEALRLFGTTEISPELKEAQKLLDWLKGKQQSVISLVEIYQFGPPSVRDSETARNLLEVLRSHGYVRPYLKGCEFKGSVRRNAWEIRPQLDWISSVSNSN